MRSLRTQLLLSLWLTLVFVGCSGAIGAYLIAQRESNDLQDSQMQQIAALIATTSSKAEPAVGTAMQPHDLTVEWEDAFLVSVRRRDGALLFASRPDIETLQASWNGFRTQTIAQHEYRLYARESGDRKVIVAQQLELRRETAGAAALSALLPVLLLVPILGLVISYVIRRQLQPFDALTSTIATRPPLTLDPLPTVDLPAELVPLVTEINRLLARQHAANEQEQRFIADAAHALRTPLTALQLQADVLDGTRDVTKRASRLAELRAGIRRAVRLANHLLLLARHKSDAETKRDQVELASAVREVCELYAPSATARNIELRVATNSSVSVIADVRDVAQLAGNLIDNALRYSAVGALVTVAVRREAGGAQIEVTDQGPGLPDSEFERVFERFYRAPGDTTEGSGLGLAVVREVAAQLGGRVRLTNRGDQPGLIATVWLPVIAVPIEVADQDVLA
ncbi:MAG: ATP-binding protein [Steroidobacteraceae bacterium]